MTGFHDRFESKGMAYTYMYAIDPVDLVHTSLHLKFHLKALKLVKHVVDLHQCD